MPKVVYLCLMFVLFSCSEKIEEKERATSLPENPNIEMESTGEFDSIANPKAKKGGTFNTWGSSFPKSLNVFLDHNAFSAEVSGLFFEPLVTLHTTRNEPVGVLAESWQVSDDKKTFTFKIHPAAKWSDGKPITAEDIQFYYDVMMNPKNMTSIYRVNLKRFKHPEVIDTRTVQVTAKEPHWENVRVPKGFRAARPGADAELFHGNVIAARILTGALAVGNAQATYETVLKYAGERIVANKPIRQHSICAGMLADMAIGIETARTYNLAAAYMFDHPEIYGPPVSDFMLFRASIAKVYAADIAVMVSNRSMELMGS